MAFFILWKPGNPGSTNFIIADYTLLQSISKICVAFYSDTFSFWLFFTILYDKNKNK